MTLTDEDYKLLASQIEEGDGYAILDKDGEGLEVYYQCEEGSYCAGLWVTTEINFQVLDVSCVNDNGEQVDHDLDVWKLYKKLKAQKVG